MRLVVCVETDEADQGYDEGGEPTLAEHADNIKELLRSGYYEVRYVGEAGGSK